ncbi:MAG: diguanylate cyclase [Alphaproteobacteria bacterium]
MGIPARQRQSVPPKRVSVAPFRLLVLGGSAEALPHMEGLAYAEDPGAGHAGIAVLAALSADELMRALAIRRHFMTPIMDFAGSLEGRADFSEAAPTAATLRAGLATFVPIIRRLEELPDFGGSPDLPSLSVLGMAYTRERPIAAEWTPLVPDAVRYPMLTGIPAGHDLLEQLSDAGLLRRRFFDRTYLCDHCGSARLIAREICSACHSSNLEEESLVHHYGCGFQGPEHAFADNGYACPKCRKQLHHFGVDYDKPGSVMVCRACDAANDDPDVSLACLDCKQQTRGDGASARDWFHYELSEEGRQALFAGSLPKVGFERLLEPYAQARQIGDFASLVGHDLETATRYERPFALATVAVTNIAALRSALGRQQASKLFAALVQQIVEVLRETDLVTAHDDEIVLAMPETGQHEAEIALQRLRQRVTETINADLQLDLQVLSDRKAVAARLDSLLERDG